MRNRTESGIHFDQSTAERPVLKVIPYFAGGEKRTCILVIPRTIYKRLNSADFEEVAQALPEMFDQHFLSGIQAGIFVLDHLRRRAGMMCQVQAVTHLYNKFIVYQAQDGNERWQVPGSMSKIGPPPEEDERWNDGSGKLVVQ